MEEQWILQETEFLILVAAMGIENIYGVRPKRTPGESEVMYAVHEMAGKGILTFESGVFRIAEPYHSVLWSVKTAKRILAVTGNSPEMADTCFYFDGRIAVLEKSRWDEHAVRIGIIPKEELYGLLCDRGFLPEPFWEPDIAGMQEAKGLEDEEVQIYAEFRILDPVLVKCGALRRFRILRSAGIDWVSDEESEPICYGRQSFYERLEDALENMPENG